MAVKRIVQGIGMLLLLTSATAMGVIIVDYLRLQRSTSVSDASVISADAGDDIAADAGSVEIDSSISTIDDAG